LLGYESDDDPRYIDKLDHIRVLGDEGDNNPRYLYKTETSVAKV
jgi:hypothetical protein